MLEIGSLIDNKYKVLNVIGQGGMSTVYLAMNERANKQWAIKEFRKDDVEKSKISINSIRTETELLKKLSHPNLPSIVDIIDYEGSVLIIMDYIEGNTLKKAIDEYGAQPQELVINWALQLCDVLGYLHSQNPPIIYRDLKPSNIMLKPNGDIVLIDFGTARQYKEDNMEDTVCLGTRGYAAPEQFGGQGQTDERTDIYCLGATIYHLITGKNPSEPPYEMLPIRDWNPALSKGLELIILKCTQNDPWKRYQNCETLQYDLDHYYELDQSYRNREIRKLAVFLTTAVVSVATAVAGIGLNVYASSYLNQEYENIETETKKVVDSAEGYIDMINIKPGEASAYINLIDQVYLKDGNFSADEDNEIRTLLISTKNKKTYEQILMENKQGYCMTCYRLGLAYFYSYEGVGNKQLSAYWFNQAASGELEESQTERAKRLGSIAEYYVNLGNMDKSGDVQVDFKEYWDDLVAVASGDIQKVDNATTALVIYKELASQICANASKFNKSGVSYSEMELKLLEIEKTASGIEESSNERIVELKEELATNIEKARTTISMLSGSR
ncbi:MAG: serine/threonine protein kinase [Pseudobutyrivibrio sp.]|nr:serine/threonine protein kinase [Pseudobutyrivibrio sp.]